MPKIDKSIIKYRIKEIRARTGLSQAKFAKAYGLNDRHLAKWEQGVAAPPSYVLDWLEIATKQRPPAGYYGIEALISNWKGEDNGCRQWIYLACFYDSPLQALDVAKDLVKTCDIIAAVRITDSFGNIY